MKLTRIRTLLLVVLIMLECCLLWAAFSERHVDKPGAGSAWYKWRQHPSPQTEAAWLAEKRKIRIQEAVVRSVNWLLIIATGAGVYYVSRGQKRQI